MHLLNKASAHILLVRVQLRIFTSPLPAAHIGECAGTTKLP